MSCGALAVAPAAAPATLTPLAGCRAGFVEDIPRSEFWHSESDDSYLSILTDAILLVVGRASF